MRFITAVLMLSLLMAGCSKKTDGWPRAAVAGEVTLDGEPLSKGQITFFPVDGTKGPAAGIEIVEGRYSIPAAEGPVVGVNRVEIRSVQSTGRMVPSPEAPMAEVATKEGMLVEEFVDVIPKQYNSQSNLKHTIEASSVNQLDFPLTSGPKK